MTTSVTEDRASFEKAFPNPYGLTRCGDPAHHDEYASPYTQGAWEGWQAAIRSQGKVVTVDALQGMCDEWENMKVPRSADSYELGMFDGYRGARRDLTAIIGEGD